MTFGKSSTDDGATTINRRRHNDSLNSIPISYAFPTIQNPLWGEGDLGESKLFLHVSGCYLPYTPGDKNHKMYIFLAEKLVAPLIATPKWIISNEDKVTQKDTLQITR